MAITRSQMARQLMQEGGVPRQGFVLGKLVRKIKDDIIPNELKNPVGIAAALTAANFAPKIIPGIDLGGENQTLLQRFLPSVSDAIKPVTEAIGGGLSSAKEAVTDVLGTEVGSGKNKTTIGNRLLSGIFGPAGLAIGSGLLAGALTKDKEDPLYTGQDVGLNLQDIAKLANITDPKTASAIGLRFSPDVEARKFTPEEMAATYAANAPRDFTEKREQAQDGGMMGDQKDFEEFLQDMKERDTGMMQDQILRDFQEYMKRKRMIEQMPEAKDGGIMKAKPKMAGYGYNEAMSDTYDSYLDMKKNGLIPPTMTFDEFLQEVVPEMSKKKGIKRTMAAEGGMMASAVGDESDDISMQLFGKPVKDLTPDEFKELQEEIDRLMNKFRGAKGGIASMAEGGMMDMGGMEMDLRGGGFVPMGRAEKADDVPARLSKNEFVFTADAVRAAGGGDVDKGADKMYATMKKLEDRVA